MHNFYFELPYIDTTTVYNLLHTISFSDFYGIDIQLWRTAETEERTDAQITSYVTVWQDYINKSAIS